jgi:hypothetical protein
MRNRFLRLLLVGALFVPTYAAAQGLQCGGFSGGFWPFGSLETWCVVVRATLCALRV